MTEHAITQFPVKRKNHPIVTQELLRSLRDAGRDFTDHSIFSPSGSAMWLNCSGSLIPNLFAPETAGEDAAVGTVAHAIGELWLKTGDRPSQLVGTTRTIRNAGKDYVVEITDSMLEYVEQYVDWCIYLPGQHFVETRVDHSDLTPLKNQTGTADHAACEFGKLTITDLKFGQGNMVFAEGNTQGLIYAYGFFKKYDDLYDFETITIRIAQPRLNHFDAWTITRDELRQHAARIKERAFAAWCTDAERSPGKKQCQWCKVKPDCAAHAVFAERLIEGVFENLDEPVGADDMEDIGTRLDGGQYTIKPTPIGTLTTAQKAALLPYRKMIEGWFKDLYDDLQTRCLNGEAVPGFKVVEGSSTREFTSKTSAEETLDFLGLDDETIHPRSMISPAQAEASLTKIGYRRRDLPFLLGDVIRKPPGRRTMVPDADKRQAVVPESSDSFDNLDDSL